SVCCRKPIPPEVPKRRSSVCAYRCPDPGPAVRHLCCGRGGAGGCRGDDRTAAGGFSWGMLLAGWASIVVGVITFLWPGRDECARRLRSRRIPAEDDRRPVSCQGRQRGLVLLCLIAFWRALDPSAARPARTNGQPWSVASARVCSPGPADRKGLELRSLGLLYFFSCATAASAA